MKITLIVGAAIFVLGIILTTLSVIYPAFNGTQQQMQAPFVNNGFPIYYGSLQVIWSLITFGGFIVALIGLIGIVVRVIKKKVANPI